MVYERTWFTVNSDLTITVNGWLEDREECEGYEDGRYTLVTGDWPDLAEPPSRHGESLVDWACPYQQYNEDFHPSEAAKLVEHFYDIGVAGEHFSLCDVNDGTPAGNYWCYFEEE